MSPRPGCPSRSKAAPRPRPARPQLRSPHLAPPAPLWPGPSPGPARAPSAPAGAQCQVPHGEHSRSSQPPPGGGVWNVPAQNTRTARTTRMTHLSARGQPVQLSPRAPGGDWGRPALGAEGLPWAPAAWELGRGSAGGCPCQSHPPPSNPHGLGGLAGARRARWFGFLPPRVIGWFERQIRGWGEEGRGIFHSLVTGRSPGGCSRQVWVGLNPGAGTPPWCP